MQVNGDINNVINNFTAYTYYIIQIKNAGHPVPLYLFTIILLWTLPNASHSPETPPTQTTQPAKLG